LAPRCVFLLEALLSSRRHEPRRFFLVFWGGVMRTVVMAGVPLVYGLWFLVLVAVLALLAVVWAVAAVFHYPSRWLAWAVGWLGL